MLSSLLGILAFQAYVMVMKILLKDSIIRLEKFVKKSFV